MQIASEALQLLTWQWVAVIAIVAFFRPLGRFLDRAHEIKIGKKGVSAKAPLANVPTAGELKEPSAPRDEVRERIEAQRFVLRDAKGRKRAELGTTETGSALFVLYDGTGRSRIALFAAENGASVLEFQDENGEPRVMLASSDPREGSPREDVTTAFSIRNGEGDIVASLLVDTGGSPALDLYSPSGSSLFNAQ